MALIECPECGKEISDKARSCPGCGCPIGTADQGAVNKITTKKQNIDIKKYLPAIIGVIVVIIIGTVIYNVKVVQPQKIEAQKKATYEEAISLLEKGKYEDGNKLLQTIPDYEDVSIISEQIIYESYAFSCVNSLKKYLKNPDSYSPYEIQFFESKEETASKYPVCIMHYGAQNGFGGNTTGYAYFTREDDANEYELLGTCDSLDEEEYDTDDEDELLDWFICVAINIQKECGKEVGSIDLNRFKTVIKNEAYSTVKIID